MKVSISTSCLLPSCRLRQEKKMYISRFSPFERTHSIGAHYPRHHIFTSTSWGDESVWVSSNQGEYQWGFFSFFPFLENTDIFFFAPYQTIKFSFFFFARFRCCGFDHKSARKLSNWQKIEDWRFRLHVSLCGTSAFSGKWLTGLHCVSSQSWTARFFPPPPCSINTPSVKHELLRDAF